MAASTIKFCFCVNVAKKRFCLFVCVCTGLAIYVMVNIVKYHDSLFVKTSAVGS